jgi:hypothetical protein
MTEREIEHERKYHYYKGYRKGVLTTFVLLSFYYVLMYLLYYYLYGGNK